MLSASLEACITDRALKKYARGCRKNVARRQLCRVSMPRLFASFSLNAVANDFVKSIQLNNAMSIDDLNLRNTSEFASIHRWLQESFAENRRKFIRVRVRTR
jgi:hypothetical protein